MELWKLSAIGSWDPFFFGDSCRALAAAYSPAATGTNDTPMSCPRLKCFCTLVYPRYARYSIIRRLKVKVLTIYKATYATLTEQTMTIPAKRSLLCDQRLFHPLYLYQHTLDERSKTPATAVGIREAAYLGNC